MNYLRWTIGIALLLTLMCALALGYYIGIAYVADIQ